MATCRAAFVSVLVFALASLARSDPWFRSAVDVRATLTCHNVTLGRDDYAKAFIYSRRHDSGGRP